MVNKFWVKLSSRLNLLWIKLRRLNLQWFPCLHLFIHWSIHYLFIQYIYIIWIPLPASENSFPFFFNIWCSNSFFNHFFLILLMTSFNVVPQITQVIENNLVIFGCKMVSHGQDARKQSMPAPAQLYFLPSPLENYFHQSSFCYSTLRWREKAPFPLTQLKPVGYSFLSTNCKYLM